MADRVTIKVTGIDEAIKNLKRYQTKKREEIKTTILKGGYKIELATKQNCDKFKEPKGRLKGSITTDKSKIDRLIVYVGTNVYYAPYVEHGHRQTPGRFVPAIGKRLVRDFVPGVPFLFPAYFMYEGEIVRDIGKVLKKDIRIK